VTVVAFVFYLVAGVTVVAFVFYLVTGVTVLGSIWLADGVCVLFVWRSVFSFRFSRKQKKYKQTRGL
jgi:predicted membrane channel-forming protein YqfA (hemolysin III family)